MELPVNEPEADEANAIPQGGEVNDDVELPQLDIDQEQQINEADGENDIPDRADAKLEIPNENKQPPRKRKLRYADAFIDEDSEIASTEYRRLIQHGILRRSEANKVKYRVGYDWRKKSGMGGQTKLWLYSYGRMCLFSPSGCPISTTQFAWE